jgi:hypothetical protein
VRRISTISWFFGGAAGREGKSFSVLRIAGPVVETGDLLTGGFPPVDHGVFDMVAPLAGDSGREEGGVIREEVGVLAAACATLSQTFVLLVLVLVPPRLVLPLFMTSTRWDGLLTVVFCTAPVGASDGKLSSCREW